MRYYRSLKCDILLKLNAFLNKTNTLFVVGAENVDKSIGRISTALFIP